MAQKAISQSIVVPGVQPKLSLHLEKTNKEQTSRLTIVGLEGNLILKPPVAEYPDMPELEHLVMRMAGEFGIQTAVSGLLPMAGGQLCFITKRMDRAEKQKLHMEDFCQITDNLTAQKYQGGSMEKVAKTVLRYCTNTGFDALRLFELTVFCFLTGNSDMHLKNFSVLHLPTKEIILSPAYDLLPVKLLLPEDHEEMALPMLGKKSNFHWEHFERWASESLMLNPVQLRNVLNRFALAIPRALELIPRGFAEKRNQELLDELIRTRAKRLGLM
jgi:serine/threonine-protein kinase HipA